jgi:hypothetical protein
MSGTGKTMDKWDVIFIFTATAIVFVLEWLHDHFEE